MDAPVTLCRSAPGEPRAGRYRQGLRQAAKRHPGLGVNRFRTHRRLLAWLGLLAMWLVTVAPVVSQCLPGASPTASGARCGDLPAHPGHPPAAPHDHSPEKCAYCALLCDSPPLAASAWLAHIVPLAKAQLHGSPRTASWTRQLSITAAPLGPPVAAHS